MKAGNALCFYSYDSVLNPWLGGGGAYRDMEILSRFRGRFGAIHLHVGYFPGATRRTIQGVEIIPLGFGSNEIVSRITYFLAANWRILFNGKKRLGISLSPYSPLFAVVFHRKRMYAVLHHIIGKNWVGKIGKFGWLLYALESLYFRLPRYFVISNDTVAKEISSRCPQAHVYRSANGFDPALLELGDASGSNVPFVLFVGRLDRFMKGLDLLVEAFAHIAVKYPKLELILAGRGDRENEQALASLARKHGLEKRISLRPNISEAEKRSLLSGCLFFCSPSRYEGWGIAALEANAAGKPVVVSQASGFKNSISDGVSGILVDLEVKGNLENALADLLEHPAKREHLARHAREWALQFTWDAIAEKEGRWLAAFLG